jgi:protein AroM
MMAAKRLGVVVVGQSPRPEIIAQMRPFLGDEVQIDLRGALDGFSRAEVAALAPANGADTLFTRLPPGQENIKLSKHAVEARAKAVIERMAADGTAVTMLCCTGEFPTLRTGSVVLPSAILSGLVNGLLQRGRLGIFIPLPEQTETLCAKWRRPGLEVFAEPLTPGSDAPAIDAAARRLAARHPDLVVMDCMSYDQSIKDRVRQTVRAPVILAIAAAARIAAELLA